MDKFFDFMSMEEDAFKGVEVQVCSETATVQFATWDHGDVQAQSSAAIPLSKAREMMAWLNDAISKAENATAA